MFRLVTLLSVLISSATIAATHYVDLNSPSPTPPYTNWITAATSIQDAVDSTVDGDTVIVANGHYSLTNQINVISDIMIKSVNGPADTVVDAQHNSRVFDLNNTESVLSGLKIINGYANQSFPNDSGGGVYGGLLITNCVISGCIADESGGASVYADTVDCLIEGNSAESSGGQLHGSATRCVFRGNSATGNGGGMSFGDPPDSVVDSCLFVANTAKKGGGIFGIYGPKVINCTIVSNRAATGGGVSGVELYNSIVFYNTSLDGSVAKDLDSSTQLYSCFPSAIDGVYGNISTPPQFVDMNTQNYRLVSGSECINSGFNVYSSALKDLDGNPRVVSGIIDMGAYESQTEISRINLPLRVILERSSDMQTWTNSGQVIEWLLPANQSNEFYRARLEI